MVKGVSPYVGIRIGGTYRVELWRASDWLKNDKKQFKVRQSKQNRVHPGFIRHKQVQCALGQWQGTRGAFFTRF